MTRYIHESPAWPNFQWDREALAAPIAALRHAQGRLLGRMEALGLPFQQQAVMETLTSDVLKTSEIEGDRLDYDEVRSSVARHLGMDVAGLKPSDRRTDGIVEMILDATRNFDSSLTEERLFVWHAGLFPAGRGGLKKVDSAAWRKDLHGPMQVVSGRMGKERVHFQAPKASRLKKEMAAFTAWFNGRNESDWVMKSALAHLRFVTIHPFDDGNGRIARAIADMALARSEKTSQRFYSMSSQIRRQRAAYYRVLEQTQKLALDDRSALDVTAWMEWFFSCLAEAIHDAESVRSSVLARAEFWQSVGGVPLNDRQRKVLNRLLTNWEGALTTSKWAALTKTSQDTAGRDIADLLARGVLVRSGAGGRSTSYSLADPVQKSAES